MVFVLAHLVAEHMNIHILYHCFKMLSCVPKKRLIQRAKKVVYDSMGLLDFAIGLMNSVFNLSDGQVMFFEEFE